LHRTHEIPPPSDEKFISLNLGKFKTVGYVMGASSREHPFETIEMSPAAVEAHTDERR